MKWIHSFRQVDVSGALRTYAQEEFEKIGRRLLKESKWHIFYKMGKIEYEVAVTVTNPNGSFKASAAAGSFYEAVDAVSAKLGKQFLKRKAKLQDHNKPERSKKGKLKRVNELLEYDDSPFLNKKTA